MKEKTQQKGARMLERDYLVFGKPDIGPEEISAVTKVLKSGWLSTGPKVNEFENKFKEYIGCRNAIATNSCTAALHLSLLCNNIGIGDEVITTSMTFCATANAITHTGATPVFVDILDDCLNIDPDKIRELITKKTKAILPVHFGGSPCDMDEINQIAVENDLPVIEDCAHALGAFYKDRKIGQENINCFSFYPTKNITTVEGGMVTTDDDKLAEKIRMYSLHGLSAHAWNRFGKEGKKKYKMLYPGYKYNMSDVNAAIGIEQLKKIDKYNLRREEYAGIYMTKLREFNLVELPYKFVNRKSSWHLFPILIRLEKLNITRDELMMALHKKGIGTGIHYEAVHLQPHYRQLKYQKLPRTEYVSERTISLPLQFTMTRDDVLYVADTVIDVLEENRK